MISTPRAASPPSDGTASGKVLKTDSAGKLSWSADSDAGASGVSYAAIVSSFVNVLGDTMTGKLIVDLTTGYDGMEVMQQFSGTVIRPGRPLLLGGAGNRTHEHLRQRRDYREGLQGGIPPL